MAGFARNSSPGRDALVHLDDRSCIQPWPCGRQRNVRTGRARAHGQDGVSSTGDPRCLDHLLRPCERLRGLALRLASLCGEANWVTRLVDAACMGMCQWELSYGSLHLPGDGWPTP